MSTLLDGRSDDREAGTPQHVLDPVLSQNTTDPKHVRLWRVGELVLDAGDGFLLSKTHLILDRDPNDNGQARCHRRLGGLLKYDANEAA